MKKYITLSIILLSACNKTKANSEHYQKNPKEIKQNLKEEEIIPGISNHWIEVKYKNNESIIFIPCDSQNTEFTIKKNNGKIFIEVIEGQDGWDLEVLNTSKINLTTTRIRVKLDNMKFSYYVQKIDENNSIWTKPETYDYEGADWSNEDLDELDLLSQKSIRMVSEQGKNFYKTVEAPPCIDYGDSR